MNKFVLEPLSDEVILQKSSGLVTNASKFHVESKKYDAITGGIYDAEIFGQKHKCRCGKVKSGICSQCRVEVLTRETEYTRFGHYRLSYPVVYEIKKKYFLNIFGDLCRKVGFEFYYNQKWSISRNLCELSFQAVELSDGNITDKAGNKYGLLIEEVNDGTEEYTIDDFDKIGVLGLYNICNNYKGLNLSEIKACINMLIVISPTVTRPASTGYDGKLMIPTLSGKYAEMIYISETIKDYLKGLNNLEDKIAISLAMENAVNNLHRSYSLLATSKESSIRYLQKVRLPKSGRATAVGVSNIKIDEIMIPEALAYECLKSDIIEKIKQIETEKAQNDPEYVMKDPFFIYDNVTPYAKEILYAIAEGSLQYNETGSVVMLNRAPTLHKLSIMAFKVKLWEHPTIGVHINVVTPFNLDFDGDTVAVYFATKDPFKSRILDKMSPKNNWFYEKNKKPVFVPTSSMLLGLYHATRLVQTDKVNKYFTHQEIIEDYIEKKIRYNEIINFNGEITSYGRETISKIIQIPLSNLIGDEPITAKNIAKIISIIGAKDDRVEIVSKLLDFSRSIVSIIGNSFISLDEVYKWMPRYDEVTEIMNSRMSQQEKYIKIEKLIPKIIDKQIKELSGTCYGHALESGAVVKKQSLYEMFSPRVDYNVHTGEMDVRNDSLITGLSESELVHHAMSNREILSQKALLVRIAGYFTKQLVDFVSDIVYRTDKLSEDTQGVLMYKCMAEGRTLITGELVPPNDSYELVRVKSCVYSSKPIVCKDEIDYNFYKYPNNYKIGYSLSTSTTEDVTQKQLGLKHGGSVYFPDPGMIVWDKDLTFETSNDQRLIVRDSNNVLLEFPISENVLMSYDLTQGFVKAGDPVVYSKRINFVDNKLASVKAILGLASNKLETTIQTVDCYAFNDGPIHYDYNKHKVMIGKKSYSMSKELYFYPEGYEVKMGDKISTGVLNTKNLMASNSIDIGVKYFIFSKALVELLIDDFKKGKMPIALESIELIIKQYYHYNSASVFTANRHNPALLSNMKGGYCRPTVQKNVGHEVKDDLLMRLIFQNNNLEHYGED